jgi:hypothetical protein
VIVLKNIVQPGSPQTIWRIRTACWISKTHTHSEYVILLLFHYNNGCTNAPHCYVIRKCTAFLVCNTFLPCPSVQSGKLSGKLHHIPLNYYRSNTFRSTWPPSGIIRIHSKNFKANSYYRF